jgi:hypothetical protein
MKNFILKDFCDSRNGKFGGMDAQNITVEKKNCSSPPNICHRHTYMCHSQLPIRILEPEEIRRAQF